MALPTAKENTTALVTGASSGIGAEIARELARRGHGLTLVARREDRLKALADELAAPHRVRAEVIATDLTDARSRAELPGHVAQRGLVVDILVNNAGFTTMGPVHRAERAAELAMVRTDVEAVVDLCTLFVPGMVTRHRGAVLNTASTAAFQPLPGQAAYGASKAFVLSYGRALGAELAAPGVTVTTLCPGPVETRLRRGGRNERRRSGRVVAEVHVGASGRRGQGGRRRPGRGPRRRDPGRCEPGRGGSGTPRTEGPHPAADGPAASRAEREGVAQGCMPGLVSELDLPYLDTIGLDRQTPSRRSKRRGPSIGWLAPTSAIR